MNVMSKKNIEKYLQHNFSDPHHMDIPKGKSRQKPNPNKKSFGDILAEKLK